MAVMREFLERKRILNEIWQAREDQVRRGYNARHDDAEHVPGILSRAAGAYATAGSDLQLGVAPDAVTCIRAANAYGWPFNDPERSWRPENERAALIKAGALIVAALQQIDRNDAPEILDDE